MAACDVEPPRQTSADSTAGETAPRDEQPSLATSDPAAKSENVTGNCGGELSPQPVDLSWSDLASVADARVGRDDTLFFRAHNTSNQAVTIHLTVEVSQRGVRRTIALEPIALAADESRRIALSQTRLGIQRVRADLAGHISIRGAVEDAKGTTIMTVFAPGRSFHMEATGDTLAFYDRETRNRKYGKGDPFGVLPPALRDDPNVLSITSHDETAQNEAGEAR